MASKVGDANAPLEQMRLDVWLCRARFFKTRTLAGESLEKKGARIDRSGHVRRVSKPSASVAIGDVVSFTCQKKVETLVVLDLPARRGPAAEASQNYRRLDEA